MPKNIAAETFSKLTRLLPKGGLMFVKLNPYYEEGYLESFGFKLLPTICLKKTVYLDTAKLIQLHGNRHLKNIMKLYVILNFLTLGRKE